MPKTNDTGRGGKTYPHPDYSSNPEYQGQLGPYPDPFAPQGIPREYDTRGHMLGGGLYMSSPSATDQALRLPAPETDLEWRSPLFPRAKATSTPPAVQVA